MTAKTSVGHVHHDDVDVFIGRGSDGSERITNSRPGESWGNPYRLSEYSRGTSIRKFAKLLDDLILDQPVYRLHLYRLSGRTLGCFCRALSESEPACHGDVLAARSDALREEFRDGERCDREDHRMVPYRTWYECIHCGISGQTLTGGGRPYDVLGDGVVGQ